MFLWYQDYWPRQIYMFLDPSPLWRKVFVILKTLKFWNLEKSICEIIRKNKRKKNWAKSKEQKKFLSKQIDVTKTSRGVLGQLGLRRYFYFYPFLYARRGNWERELDESKSMFARLWVWRVLKRERRK